MAAVQIYSASAGSGKTFTLVKEYLKILFARARFNHYTAFRNILAITFTNKATDEMKQRVISALKEIAAGTESDLLKALREELVDIDDFPRLADHILKKLLRDFSSFNIQTIDSFFQDIIRSFARELRLPLNFEVDLKKDHALDFAVDELVNRIGFEQDLTRWLREYAFSRMNDDKGWNFRPQLVEMSRELFDDDLDLEKLKPTAEKIVDIRKELNGIISAWQKNLAKAGLAIWEDIETRNIPLDAYYVDWKKNIRKVMDEGRGLGALNTFKKQLQEEKPMFKKKVAKELHLAEDAYRSAVYTENSAILYRLLDDDILLYNAAIEARKNIYALGVIHRLNEMLKKYRQEKNILFIMDAARLISDFISLDEMPFLFEKIGSRIEYLFIDEFQDTSSLQWTNILPLLMNILSSSGKDMSVLLVGDAKQSIYRWRGGDYRLITGEAARTIAPFETEVIQLDTNYRSLPEIISFNNRFFESLHTDVVQKGPELLREQISLTYQHVRQIAKKTSPPGKVSVRLAESDEGSWKDAALAAMDEDLAGLREAGYAYQDIAILVKTRREGIEISRHLQHSGIEVLSAETLLLKFDPEVKLVLAALYYINDSHSNLHYTNLLWQYGKLHPEKTGMVSESVILSDFKQRELLGSWIPEFPEEADELSFLSCYQVFERVSAILGINETGNLFVSHLKQVLFDFFKRESASLADFLAWWEENEDDISISLESGRDRVNIMTIHKAKGLEFPAVLIPYCDWKIHQNMHKDLLWLSDPAIASDSQLPYQAVRRLSESIFYESFDKEQRERWIDTANVLYVAMTRAEEVLSITLPASKPDTELPKTAAKLIIAVLQHWDINTEKAGIAYESGEIRRPEDSKGISQGDQEEELHPAEKSGVSPLKDFAEISLSSKYDSRETRIGTLVHDSLSMDSEVDIKNALNRAVQKGRYMPEEIGKAREHLARIDALPALKEWLLAARRTWNEQDLWYGNKIHRPDKILQLDDRIIVIDYKTGGHEEKYHNQVRSYTAAVKEIFPGLLVEGYILYTENGTLEAVPELT